MNTMAINRDRVYPPLRVEGNRQLANAVFLGRQTDPSHYIGTEFSLYFTKNYGVDLFRHYTDFSGYMNTIVTIKLPRYRKNFAWFAQHVPFARFRNDVDDLATQTSKPLAGRIQMEAAYVQVLFMKFDEVDQQQISVLIAGTEWTAQDVKLWMQGLLKVALAQARFDP